MNFRRSDNVGYNFQLTLTSFIPFGLRWFGTDHSALHRICWSPKLRSYHQEDMERNRSVLSKEQSSGIAWIRFGVAQILTAGAERVAESNPARLKRTAHPIKKIIAAAGLCSNTVPVDGHMAPLRAFLRDNAAHLLAGCMFQDISFPRRWC